MSYMVRFRALHTRALCVHGCCIDRVTTSPFVHKDVGMRPAAPYPLPCPVVVGTLLTAISAASAAVDRPLSSPPPLTPAQKASKVAKRHHRRSLPGVARASSTGDPGEGGGDSHHRV